MGFETVAMMGLGALQNQQTQKNAKSEANATVAQGAIDAQNEARRTQLKGASATVSYLNSGLTLEGTPSNAVAGIYQTGLADVNQTIANANTKSKNIYSQARAKMLDNLMKSSKGLGLGGLDLPGMSGLPGSESDPINWNQPDYLRTGPTGLIAGGA